MKTALIGHTGFVGSNLARQLTFSHYFNSSNIQTISGECFDAVYCAGIQAKKWWANQHPGEDKEGVAKLLQCLGIIKTDLFVMISTIDVYDFPVKVDEDSVIDQAALTPYGLHRLQAEQFIRNKFPRHLVVRLPGLFGPGLKKNVLYDLLNNHETEKINVHNSFQYYDLRHLAEDINHALEAGLDLLNIATEPISTLEISKTFFPVYKLKEELSAAVSYDMNSKYWNLWHAGIEGYLYKKQEVLSDMSDFIADYRS